MLTNLKVDPEQLPKRVIVCGDPKRAALIASKLDDQRQIGENREYHSYAGTWKGVEVAVVSHGVGAPGAAVCFEELAKGGVQVIIRVGTAGSYQKEIETGSLVISSAAVRQDGLTSQLVPAGFPAVANRHVVDALVQAAGANASDLKVVEGITLTLDVFYSGVLEFPHKLYQKAGVLAVEMENTALFVIAALRGIKAGSILAIDGYADADLLESYNPHTDVMAKAIEAEALIALGAVIAVS
ncbi:MULTISPECIES: nucleoside phosphorylase [Brevibacillus]|uniref:nucleoside phosphorylase n=1 Tax=Brevibacillus TaxID=55080 RepID=UPI000D0E691F|nr:MULTISPECIES: nucleoside phosphorylase [Brevibacillus]MED1944875.1 nucleoside phosphorylase [Brevibacillus formosus]MED1996438.1 nucleoside phosphorylase [Brevibacillus formosus]MED2081407.1 nucleoside phosphorylase [Brevibacillus formosus]PSK19808.1 purine-nucleoside phosphorylase [Brevibacillus sp. NRRL NRS-603]